MKKFIPVLLAIAAYTLCYGQLRVVTPNGGELYPAGGSMEIRWAGVGPDEIVELDYTTNKGKSWFTITEKAKGLKYIWENIPKIPSQTCLIRVRQPDANPNGYKLEHTLRHEINGISRFLGFRWSPSGNKMLSICDFNNLGHIWVWDTHTGERISVIKMPGNRFHSVEWSPDEKYIGTHSDDDEIIIWDAETGDQIRSFSLGNSGFSRIHWNSDGSRFSYIDNLYGTSYRVITYNTKTWEIKSNISLSYDHNKLHIYCGLQNNEEKIVAFIEDTVFVIDTEKGNIIKQFTYHYTGEHPQYWDEWNNGYGYGWAWGQYGDNNTYRFLCPDNSKILLPDDDSTLSVLDFNTGEKLFSLDYGYNGYIYYYFNFANWSPDSRKVITYDTNAIYSNIINIRDTENGNLLNSISNIYRFLPDWNPDSYRIAGYGGDKSIRIINSENSKILQNIISPDTILFYDWSPDGKRIAASCFDSTIRIWSVRGPYTQEDVSDSAWSTVRPMAVSMDIDMGRELVGYQKDSLIKDYIFNPGMVKNSIVKLYFEGPDKDMFSANSGNKKLDIGAESSIPVDFHFKPTSPGMKTADIILLTYTDTLRYNITGEGVLPEIALLNNNIDFGEVMLKKSKDSLVLLLHNKSQQPVRIDSMNLAGANPGEFEIPNNLPFFIKSNEQKEILLRFKPSAVGKQTCNIECYFNGPGSPTVTQLLGTGIFRPAEIQAGNITFESLICKQSTESAIPLTNNGMEGLIIKGAEIKGANQSDFEIVPPFTQMTILPDETKNINLLFKPTSTGIRNATLEIKSNSYVDSILTIQLTSTKDSIALIPEVSKIDLGYLCPGENKDTSLTISNSGTIQTGGYAIPTAGLSLENPEFTIDKANSVSIPFRFVGKPDEGIFNETITITDSVCGYSRIVEISGEIALPVIEISDVLFTTRKGKTKDSQLSITNTGKRDLLMPNPPVITPPFALIGNPFPLMVPAGESREITVRFTPVDTLEVIQDITFAVEPCSINTMFAINGKGYEARARLRAGYAEGYAGDKVEIPVYLEEPQYLSLAGASKFKADLLFNPTVLAPQERQITMIDNNTGSVSLENLPLTGIAGEEIARVKFTAALGNAEYNPIYFSNIESEAGEIEFDTVSGCFRLLGVCRDGGDRLINSTGGVILSILPNPAGETLEIELGLWESGRTRLYLSDITGNEIKQLFDGNVTTYGKRKLTANLNKLADGVYFVILQTPSGRQSAVIVKN